MLVDACPRLGQPGSSGRAAFRPVGPVRRSGGHRRHREVPGDAGVRARPRGRRDDALPRAGACRRQRRRPGRGHPVGLRPERHPLRVRPARHRRQRQDRSPSSTPTTTRRPRATSPSTARSSVSPACTTANGCFKKVNQNGQTTPLPPKDTTGWSGEIALDLDMVSAACPDCNIILVEADSPHDRQPRRGRQRRRLARRGRHQQQLRRLRGLDGHVGVDHVLQPPGHPRDGELRRQRLLRRRAVPGDLPVRPRRRRHVAREVELLARLGRVGLVERRQRLQRPSDRQAELPDGHRLHEAHGGRRLGGRRPEHRRRRVPVRQVGGLRRHERLVADRRRGVHAPRAEHAARVVRLLAHVVVLRRHERQQRHLLGELRVQGGRRLRRSDGHRDAERRRARRWQQQQQRLQQRQHEQRQQQRQHEQRQQQREHEQRFQQRQHQQR